MEVGYQDLGLKDGYLYETIATTTSSMKDKSIPNASCMGIRINNNRIIIRSYHTTKTYRNLTNKSLICINFVDDISLYALAALKGPFLSKEYEMIPENYYNYYSFKNKNSILKSLKTDQVPYLMDAWGLIICKIEKAVEVNKEDNYGMVELTEFNLVMLSTLKLKDSYKLFNRAENITLEILVLTTRLKIAFEQNRHNLAMDIQSKIDSSIKSVNQFSKNSEVSKTINLVEEYIRNLKLKF